jgi:hypothetical protein
LQTHEFKGLQVTGYEKSFLEILAAKVLNPRAQKSDIQSEEKRLIHEASLRRHGELAHNVVVRPALPDPTQPVSVKAQNKPTSAPSVNVKDDRDTNKQTLPLEMDVEEDDENNMGNAPATSSTGRIRKKRRVGEEEDDELEVVFHFPQEGVVGSHYPWFAGSATKSAQYPLRLYSSDGNNLIKAKLRVPENSKGWAFNITPLSDIFSTNIYFHFNPRYKKEKVYMNHKYGTWGDELRISAGKQYERNDIKANDIILKILIQDSGFFVFANDIFTAFFPKRNITYAMEKDLKIEFPCEDANGKAYDVRVDQVWWGREENPSTLITPEIQLLVEAAETARDELPNIVSPMMPRSIIIRNMPISNDLHDLQDLEFMITDKLEADIGKETVGAVSISLIRGASIGYARFTSTEMAQRAAEVINEIEIDDDEYGMTFHFRATLVQDGEIGHESDGENVPE